MRLNLERRRVHAAAEVVSVATVYILISTTAASFIDLSFVFPAHWTSLEKATGSAPSNQCVSKPPKHINTAADLAVRRERQDRLRQLWSDEDDIPAA